MRNISSTTRSVSSSETQGEAGDFTAPIAGKEFYKDLIDRANTVPLVRIFKHYGLRIDDKNVKIICPFKSHKGGRENTASFQYYPDTKTFWCHGCKTGVRSCDFVATIDNTTKTKAAFKILDLFSADADDDVIIDKQDFSERLEMMIEFSNTIREFRKSNTGAHAHAFIENICMVYDTMNLRHDLNNDALRSVVAQLKEEIISYTPCLTQ